jgi:hypothetical protein
MISKEAFIEQWRHELGGMILDGATANLTGAAMALWARNILKRVDLKLSQMYDALSHKEGAKDAPIDRKTK